MSGENGESNSPLFNADETRFMNDSLSNADSFDPFTVGAPGFKVPNVLPANLGGIGAAPAAKSYLTPQQNEGSSNVKGAYGHDKSLQLQQLDTLRSRYLEHRKHFPNQHLDGVDFSGMAGPSSAPDLSNIGQSLHHPSSWHSHHNHALHSAPDGPGLAQVALQFPSSHQFPAARNANGHHQHHTPMDLEHNTRPAMYADRNVLWNTSQSMPSSQLTGSGTVQQSYKSSSSAAAALAGTMEPDAPYLFDPAPRPPVPTIDLEKAAESKVIPEALQEASFAPKLSRLQPHLAILRQEQLRRKERGLSANIRKGEKKVNSQARDKDDEGADGKKKAPHTLLTEAEKKANHIASEQKRRANIRKGYDMLCEIVPKLQENVAQEGEGSDDDEDEEQADEEGDGSEPDAKRGKKRRAGPETSTEKADPRSGPRNEATILMHGECCVRRIFRADPRLQLSITYAISWKFIAN